MWDINLTSCAAINTNVEIIVYTKGVIISWDELPHKYTHQFLIYTLIYRIHHYILLLRHSYTDIILDYTVDRL